jgi:hypothetical protein
MFLKVRRHVTYANVAMTLTLVFAMAGGAIAAGSKHHAQHRKRSAVVITSIHQISRSVVAALKGNLGPVGPEGKQGPAGSPGKDGVNGVNGKNGESVTASEVKVGEAACNKLGGSKFTVAGKEAFACNGQTGFTATLPEGKTEMGTWALTVPAENPTFKVPVSRTSISYVIPLAKPPAAIYLTPAEIGTEHTTECPGTAEEPKAAEGFLCVYAQNELNTPALTVSPDGAIGAFLGGFGGQPGGVAIGSWAVTAD